MRTDCRECGGTGIYRPEGCICIQFTDTNNFRIADLTCPVHGVRGTVQSDGEWGRCRSCSMDAPGPVTGETIWMRCPYTADLCGADASLIVETVSDDEVVGVLICAAGHRWRLSRLGDGPEEIE